MLTLTEQQELDQINQQYYSTQEKGLTPAEQQELDQINQQYYELELPPNPEVPEQYQQYLPRQVEDMRGQPGQGQESNISRMMGALPGMGETAVDAISQGVTLGHADELAGIVGAPIRMMMNPGQRITDAYAEARDAARSRSNKLKSENPVTAFTGELAGGMATGMGLMNKLKYAQTAKTALGMGALEGAVYGSGKNTELSDLPMDMVKGAGSGAAGGVIGHGLGRMFRPAAGSTQDQLIKEADEFDYPLKWGEVTDSPGITSAEDVLDYLPFKPYINDLDKRATILNKGFLDNANLLQFNGPRVPGAPPTSHNFNTVTEMYDYIRNHLDAKDFTDAGKLTAKFREANSNNIWVPGLKNEFVEAVTQPNAFSPITGNIDPDKISKSLASQDWERYGQSSQDEFARLMRVGKKFPPIDPTVGKSARDKTNSLLGMTAATGLGFGLSNFGPAALLTPIGVTEALKMGNRLARNPNLLRQLSQAGTMGAEQVEDDDLLGLLGLLGGGGWLAKQGVDAVSSAYDLKKKFARPNYRQ